MKRTKKILAATLAVVMLMLSAACAMSSAKTDDVTLIGDTSFGDTSFGDTSLGDLYLAEEVIVAAVRSYVGGARPSYIPVPTKLEGVTEEAPAVDGGAVTQMTPSHPAENYTTLTPVETEPYAEPTLPEGYSFDRILVISAAAYILTIPEGRSIRTPRGELTGEVEVLRAAYKTRRQNEGGSFFESQVVIMTCGDITAVFYGGLTTDRYDKITTVYNALIPKEGKVPVLRMFEYYIVVDAADGGTSFGWSDLHGTPTPDGGWMFQEIYMQPVYYSLNLTEIFMGEGWFRTADFIR